MRFPRAAQARRPGARAPAPRRASPRRSAGGRLRCLRSARREALRRTSSAAPPRVDGDDRGERPSERRRGEGEHGEPRSKGEARVRHRPILSPTHWLTANVTFFAKALTLFADRRAYERLDADQRAAIRKAAEQTVARVASHPPPEAALVRRYCDGGRVVTASRDDLAALARAAQPVYAELERDPQTRALIGAIRALKATTPAPAEPAPPDCEQDTPTAQGRRLSPSTLNGTYRWRLTEAAAVAAGNPNDPDIGIVNTMTLRDGRWMLQGGATGTYEVIGNRVVFDWSQVAATLTFTFERHANGDLDIEPVLPMDRGDRFEWAAEPWRRVGPPVRAIP